MQEVFDDKNPTAQNSPNEVLQQTPDHAVLFGAVRLVHVVPLGEVIMLVLAVPFCATATNNDKEGLQQTDFQFREEVASLAVHVSPFVEVATLSPPTETNIANSGTQIIEYILFVNVVVIVENLYIVFMGF